MSEKLFCLFCGDEITDDCDVAECSYCGGIYHMDCRKEIDGCVVPGCYASNIPALDDSSESLLCADDSLCRSEALSELCIKNKDYYRTIFGRLGNKRVISWNWSAFFFNFLWLIYRKMYFHSVMCVVIILAASFLNALTSEFFWLSSFVTLLIFITVPLFGNYFYYKKIRRIYGEYETLSIDEKEDFIKKNAGTSLTAAIAALVIFNIISVVITIFSYVVQYEICD